MELVPVVTVEKDDFGEEVTEALECTDWRFLSNVPGAAAEDVVKTGLILKEEFEFREEETEGCDEEDDIETEDKEFA